MLYLCFDTHSPTPEEIAQVLTKAKMCLTKCVGWPSSGVCRLKKIKNVFSLQIVNGSVCPWRMQEQW